MLSTGKSFHGYQLSVRIINNIPLTRVGYELLDSGRAADTKSAIISSYPTSVSGTIVLLNTRQWIQYLSSSFLPTPVFGHFKEKLPVIKVSVSIFGQTAVYRIYTVSREPIRLPKIQYPVFGI